MKQYVRDLEEALIKTLAPLGVEGTRLEGLTGVWLQRPPRKIASIGVHVSRWVTTHGYALNVDLDPAPFTDWITACGLEDAMFTTIARELDRPVTVDEVRPHAVAALEDVFGLELEELPAEDGAGLWPQPRPRAARREPLGQPLLAELARLAAGTARTRLPACRVLLGSTRCASSRARRTDSRPSPRPTDVDPRADREDGTARPGADDVCGTPAGSGRSPTAGSCAPRRRR